MEIFPTGNIYLLFILEKKSYWALTQTLVSDTFCAKAVIWTLKEVTEKEVVLLFGEFINILENNVPDMFSTPPGLVCKIHQVKLGV